MKKRREFPNFLELPYKFDIQALQAETKKLMKEDWGSLGTIGRLTLGAEYTNLCERYTDISKNFELDEGNVKYEQLAFTEFGGDQHNFDYKVNGTVYNDPNDDERNYNKLNDLCSDFWKNIRSTFKSPVTRMRLAKMSPHSKIAAHKDYDTDYSIRVHIPIFTNKDCFFFMKRPGSSKISSKHMEANGSCWFFNQGMEHWVINGGDEERIHLILSINGQEDLE